MNHDELTACLYDAIRHDRLAHALLITGSATLRQSLALKVTQGLLCRAEKRPCGVCGDCRKAAAKIHPNVFILEPEEKKSVSIAQVRRLLSALSARPAAGEARIAIIPNMAELHAQAQNALLKLLEEPPQGVTLLLMGQEADALPTVRSRCFVVRAGLEDNVVMETLRQEAAEAFIRLCQPHANPWDSESYWNDNREQIYEVLEIWTQCAHDMLRLRILGHHAALIHAGMKNPLAACAGHFTIPHIHGMIELLWEAGKRLQGNANFALCGQWLLLRLLEA